MARVNPDEDLGGRSLLGVLSAGFIVVGLFLLVMDYLESDGPSYELFWVCTIGLGLLGLLGATIGRAFERWLLAVFGVVLIVSAVDGLISSLSWASALGWVDWVVLGLMLLFGVIGLVVACRSMLARRRARLAAVTPRQS